MSLNLERRSENRAGSIVPASDRLQQTYEEINHFLIPNVTIAQLQKQGISPGKVVTILHLLDNQELADRLWEETQPIYEQFWRNERPIRERSYEITMEAMGLRTEFAEKVAATLPPPAKKILCIDIGGGTGHQVSPMTEAIRTAKPEAEVGAIVADLDSEIEPAAIEQLHKVGSLFHQSVSIADFSDGLVPALKNRVASCQPDTILAYGFYAPTYMPLKRLGNLSADIFDLGDKLKTPTAFHILMLNPEFDPRILAAKFRSEIAPQLAKTEKGRQLLKAVPQAFAESIPHGERIKARMPVYPNGAIEEYLGRRYDVETQSVLFGHSVVLSVYPRL